MEVIPMESLFDDSSGQALRSERRVAIARADIIIGVDATTQNEFTVFGTPALEESVRIGREVAMRTLRIGIDETRGELEKLVALVRAIKRGQDYMPE